MDVPDVVADTFDENIRMSIIIFLHDHWAPKADLLDLEGYVAFECPVITSKRKYGRPYNDVTQTRLLGRTGHGMETINFAEYPGENGGDYFGYLINLTE